MAACLLSSLDFPGQLKYEIKISAKRKKMFPVLSYIASRISCGSYFIPRVAPCLSIMYIQTGVEKENVFVGIWESISLPVGALEVGLPSFGHSEVLLWWDPFLCYNFCWILLFSWIMSTANVQCGFHVGDRFWC